MNAPHHPMISETALLAAFADTIRAAGLEPPDQIDADGKIHRFSSSGQRGDEAGWYLLHLDGVAAGSFGCWRAGLSSTWCAKADTEMNQAERDAHRERVRAMQAARQAEQDQRQQEARKQAGQRWEVAPGAPADHPYLIRKGIKPHGVKVEGGALLVPMHLVGGGTLQSLQTIQPDGGKRFLPGGRVKGCFFLVGELEEIEPSTPLVICEGFATGASIHEGTGYPVAVAFNAGNLLAVAQSLRVKFPTLALVLAADDDHRTEGNPGITKATEAAQAVGGVLAVPSFPDGRGDKDTDFNDLHQLAGGGLEAVRACFEVALTKEAPEPAPAIRIPGEDDRPVFLVLDDWHDDGGTRYAPGVWHFGLKAGRKADDPPELTQQRVCGPLHIEAVTTDTQDGNYGRLLRFRTTTGRWKRWAMPMAMLKGDGADLRGELLGMGLDIAHRGRDPLTAYLQHRAPARVIQCATQTGWAGPDRAAFVLPDAVIGPQADGVTFQSEHHAGDEYSARGTLAGWQAGTAALAVGNPMLALALCTAFAGPVLALVGADSGGLNTIGASSKGKSSMLFAACSVWGGPSYRRNWRATGNGLESVAALFNDSLLALDEISQCDPREVGETVYMLGNGQGKTRAARTGGARAVARWRVSILSNGERSITATMEEGGFKTKAGQAVRIIDLPVTDQKYGAWDTLHHYPSGAALSDALRREAETHYGHAGRAFLERLTRDDHDQVRAVLAAIKARPEFNAEAGEGQFQRVAARFAVLALAGELATAYGVTPWPEGEAIRAAAVGLRLWLGMRDGKTTDAEGPQVVDQVLEFLERHGDSRFSDADSEHEQPVRDRAGWWRQRDGERVYLFLPSGMREALRGFDYRRALQHLEHDRMIRPASARGERHDFPRIRGATQRVLTVKPQPGSDA